LVAWSVYLALALTIPAALLGLAGSLAMALWGGQFRKKGFFKKLLLVNSFLIFIWLTIPFSFSVPGEVWWGWKKFEITHEGALLAAFLSLKAMGITTGALTITGISSVLEFMTGAKALGVPDKLVSLMLLMTRYVKVVGHEYGHLRDAMRIRGFQANFSMHVLKSLANLCGMLLVRGFERAERVYAAMLCRGYHGKFYVEGTLGIKAIDYYFVFFVLGWGALITVANIKWKTLI
jgi:cobalt/nickel transport system permease protein